MRIERLLPMLDLTSENGSKDLRRKCDVGAKLAATARPDYYAMKRPIMTLLQKVMFRFCHTIRGDVKRRRAGCYPSFGNPANVPL